MHQIEDIIVAVSSASPNAGQVTRSIVRASGMRLWEVLAAIVRTDCPPRANGVMPCRIQLSRHLEIDGVLYCFFSPHSYTGEDMAELHLWAAADVVSLLLERLCGQGGHINGKTPTARLARPGEFTLRAYLNGKMDLTQAEAVAQVVSSANTVQLAAAEKLLHGRFSATIADVRNGIFELLGLIEAGLDFVDQDIEIISPADVLTHIAGQRQTLQELLDGSVRLERMIDLDAVGLAGLPNAGKSSLLNALLGTPRSIVSPIEATTRDILTGVLELDGFSCVLFDCAGLLPETDDADVPGLPSGTSRREQHTADRLAQQAAGEALSRAAMVLFCVDAGRPFTEADMQILARIGNETIIPVATKADCVDEATLKRRIAGTQHSFDRPYIITSARTGDGLDALKDCIKKTLITGHSGPEYADRLTLNRRHQQRLEEAVKLLGEAADETEAGRDDIAAMLLRQCYETLGHLEREDVSEKILDSIFSRFCIGK